MAPEILAGILKVEEMENQESVMEVAIDFKGRSNDLPFLWLLFFQL